MHDDEDDMTPGSPASTDAMSVLGGGGRSSVGDSEAGGAAVSATARGRGGGQGDPSDGSGEEGGAGWGKQWATHRRSILREFDVSGGASGADKVNTPKYMCVHVCARVRSRGLTLAPHDPRQDVSALPLLFAHSGILPPPSGVCCVCVCVCVFVFVLVLSLCRLGSKLVSPLAPRCRSNAAALTQAGGPVARASPAAPTARVAARLEELEGPAEGGGGKGARGDGGSGGGGKKAKNVAGRGMAGGLLLTPDEYRAHVGGLQSELETAWANEEKVAALKVTVQVRKQTRATMPRSCAECARSGLASMYVRERNVPHSSSPLFRSLSFGRAGETIHDKKTITVFPGNPCALYIHTGRQVVGGRIGALLLPRPVRVGGWLARGVRRDGLRADYV